MMVFCNLLSSSFSASVDDASSLSLHKGNWLDKNSGLVLAVIYSMP